MSAFYQIFSECISGIIIIHIYIIERVIAAEKIDADNGLVQLFDFVEQAFIDLSGNENAA